MLPESFIAIAIHSTLFFIQPTAADNQSLSNPHCPVSLSRSPGFLIVRRPRTGLPDIGIVDPPTWALHGQVARRIATALASWGVS
jgi:hypothetical protein